MVRTLQKASVLDDELAWSGGNTHLVIVGDIVDRGWTCSCASRMRRTRPVAKSMC
jgi:hypothetical protein